MLSHNAALIVFFLLDAPCDEFEYDNLKTLYAVAHHLYFEVHHLLVKRCLCPFNLLNPLEGNKQQNMSQCSTNQSVMTVDVTVIQGAMM